jgi:hypothetical protein
MKSTLRNAIPVLVLVLAGAYQPVRAQMPEVGQLLRDVQARYASLQSYSATGEVRGGVMMDDPSGAFPAGQQTQTLNTFTIDPIDPPADDRVIRQQRPVLR